MILHTYMDGYGKDQPGYFSQIYIHFAQYRFRLWCVLAVCLLIGASASITCVPHEKDIYQAFLINIGCGSL